MYRVAGELVVQIEEPETLLGQYGFIRTVNNAPEPYTGSEGWANSAVTQFNQKSVSPVEVITPDNIEKFAAPRIRPVRASRLIEPNLIKILEKRVGKDERLLAGSGILTKGRLEPILRTAVVYSLEEGWQETMDLAETREETAKPSDQAELNPHLQAAV